MVELGFVVGLRVGMSYRISRTGETHLPLIAAVSRYEVLEDAGAKSNAGRREGYVT
jgi:hypothetical protein